MGRTKPRAPCFNWFISCGWLQNPFRTQKNMVSDFIPLQIPTNNGVPFFQSGATSGFRPSTASKVETPGPKQSGKRFPQAVSQDTKNWPQAPGPSFPWGKTRQMRLRLLGLSRPRNSDSALVSMTSCEKTSTSSADKRKRSVGFWGKSEGFVFLVNGTKP